MGLFGFRLFDKTKDYAASVNSDGSLNISSLFQTNTGTASVLPQFTKIASTISAGTTLITGVASSTIRILAGLMIAKVTVDVQLFSGSSTSTSHTGVLSLPGTGGFQIPYCPIGNWTCASGSGLVLNVIGTATTLGGWLVYTQA